MEAAHGPANGVHKRSLAGEPEAEKRQKTAWQALPLGDEVRQLPVLAKDGREHEQLKEILAASGLRASAVMVPRRAVSVYTHYSDEAKQAMREKGKAAQLVQLMLGMHPDQTQLEEEYAAVMPAYVADRCLQVFRLAWRGREVPEAMEAALQPLQNVPAGCTLAELDAKMERVFETVDVAGGGEIRSALEKEYLWAKCRNGTLANACLQLFLQRTKLAVQEVVLKTAHDKAFERLTIVIYDPEIGGKEPGPICHIPKMYDIVFGGVDAVVEHMAASFWDDLWLSGYFPPAAIRERLNDQLRAFFRSGMVLSGGVVPLAPANFSPAVPFALYLHGNAGAGKSSFVQKFRLALGSTLAKFVDPELQVRLVKQNLNKSHQELDDELTLRPNNNDLSTMSLIQGRRQTLAQTKPGLVCIHLEEVPPDDGAQDIHQAETLSLLAHRFRGIAKDCSLLSFFTSNYPLSPEMEEQLRKLAMFSQLQVIEWHAIAGDERRDYINGYIVRNVHEAMKRQCLGPVSVSVRELSMQLGNGDIRPLVKYARSLAFWMVQRIKELGSSAKAEFAFCVRQRDGSELVELSLLGDPTPYVTLRFGPCANLFPVDGRVVESRVEGMLARIAARSGRNDLGDLGYILDSYFAGVLAPAVVVSRDGSLVSALIDELSKEVDITGIPNIDPSVYKLSRSLYDPSGTENLRDDIRRSLIETPLVAVELITPSLDAQMTIRELVEDTPSMIAFSTDRSALHKRGLFFAVSIGDELSPELESRMSLLL